VRRVSSVTTEVVVKDVHILGVLQKKPCGSGLVNRRALAVVLYCVAADLGRTVADLVVDSSPTVIGDLVRDEGCLQEVLDP
jgi:hypothetical protein